MYYEYDNYENLEKVALEELHKERKIEAIRQVRIVTNWDLREAKAFVDAVCQINNIMTHGFHVFNHEHVFPSEYEVFLAKLHELHQKRLNTMNTMKGLLKPFWQIIKECEYYNHKEGSHYWTFFYNLDGRVLKLGFRDFYKAYFDSFVEIRPKYDRKKRIMTDRVEVMSKKGKFIFTAMKCWFEYFSELSDSLYVDPVSTDMHVSELSWDELFDV